MVWHNYTMRSNRTSVEKFLLCFLSFPSFESRLRTVTVGSRTAWISIAPPPPNHRFVIFLSTRSGIHTVNLCHSAVVAAKTRCPVVLRFWQTDHNVDMMIGQGATGKLEFQFDAFFKNRTRFKTILPVPIFVPTWKFIEQLGRFPNGSRAIRSLKTGITFFPDDIPSSHSYYLDSLARTARRWVTFLNPTPFYSPILIFEFITVITQLYDQTIWKLLDLKLSVSENGEIYTSNFTFNQQRYHK